MNAKEFGEHLEDLRAAVRQSSGLLISHNWARPLVLFDTAMTALEAHHQELKAAEKGVTLDPTCELAGALAEKKGKPNDGKIGTCSECGKAIPDNNWQAIRGADGAVLCMACEAKPPSTEARLEALEVKQAEHRQKLVAHWDCIGGKRGLGSRLNKLTTRIEALETGQRGHKREMTRLQDELREFRKSHPLPKLVARVGKLEGKMRDSDAAVNVRLVECNENRQALREYERRLAKLETTPSPHTPAPHIPSEPDVEELVGALRGLRAAISWEPSGATMQRACELADAILKKRDPKREETV